MIVHGDLNIGKTLILHKSEREHPPAYDYEAGGERRPVISVQMPVTPDQHRFDSALLFELGAPHSANARLSVFERLVGNC